MFRFPWTCVAAVAALATLFSPALVRADFDLVINTTGASAAQQAEIDLAEALWEDAIAGYQTGISINGIAITLGFAELGGGTLGQAGPNSFVNQGGFRLSTAGNITLDDDLGIGSIQDVTAHEIGHVLGIGTLWTSNDVYENGSGEYTGAFGLAAYQEEFDASATFVPVELGGGGGTANSHWDESGFFASELMSGFLGGSNFLSNTTVEHLRDLGFDTLGGLADLTGVDGDVNQDGLLTQDDFDDFILGWRSSTEGLGAVERTMLGDLNLNGLTDLSDFFLLREAFNEPARPRLELPSELVTVPEPASVGLALFGVAVLALAVKKEMRAPLVRSFPAIRYLLFEQRRR